ncbi:CsbD-like [Desulfonatronum zhilinae]|nr:CsbD-like [Desulfonatronum zhilinae]
MKSSTQDKAEGKMHQAKGKIKETAGSAVGNEELEAKGKGENLKGKAQDKAGDVKKVVGK